MFARAKAYFYIGIIDQMTGCRGKIGQPLAREEIGYVYP